MSTSIDSLDIQISASANSANSEISTLITRLSALQKSLTSVGGSGFKNYTNNASKATNQTKSFGSALNKMNNSANKTAKSTKSLAYAFGKFYANYFLFIRAFKGLFNSIESTADYIEAFNYFNVALGKIGSEWSHQFEKYGYENAEVYAESFNQRLTQALSGLSGVQVSIGADGSGLLTETGMKNLGLNIKEVTQYASQLASVTNSVGQTGEVSIAAANAFTKLGADISSLFNLNYSAVMTNLQSGLIGQSRALYKYGIDITNATLQTYAYELGLSKAVSEMTQAEKMQLRMIAILDQSKVSWGDLANTIESPSNMIRQFKNNLQEAGMVLGQLFMPLLQKVLPVINGVTIAIKRLLVNIAGFLGIQLDLSSFGQGYSDMADDASSLSDSLDDATASAKKLKTATLGIDELNINAPQDDASSSSAGISTIDLTDEIISATDEYQKVWQEAFDKMESKAQAFADTFEKMFKPIGTIFEDIALGDFLKLGEDVSSLVTSIFDYFTNAISQVDWHSVGANVGNFLAGIDWTSILSSIGGFIWEGITGAIDFASGMFSTAPIETTLIAGLASLPLVTTFLESGFFAKISEMFALWLGGAGTFSESFLAIFGVGGVVTVALAALAAGLGIVYATNEDVRKSFEDATNVIGQNLKPLLEVFTDKILPDLQAGWNGLLDIFKPLGDFLNTVFVSIWQDMINPALMYLGETVLPIVTDTLTNLWTNVMVPLGEYVGSVLEPVIQTLSNGLTYLWQNVVVPLAGAIGGVLGKAFEGIMEIVNVSLIPIWNAVIDVMTFLWKEVMLPIAGYLQDRFAPIFENVFGVIQGLIEGLSTAFGGLIDFVTGVFTLNWEKAWQGVQDIFKGIFNGLVSIVEGVVNFIIGGINNFTSGFRGLVNDFGEIIGIDINIPDIPNITIPRFETGGFPEDGLFMANHNELVGQFSNGKTAVANNEQIVAGITAGVREANSEEIYLLRQQNELLTRLLEKDMSVNIGDRDIARANARGQRSLGYQLVT